MLEVLINDNDEAEAERKGRYPAAEVLAVRAEATGYGRLAKALRGQIRQDEWEVSSQNEHDQIENFLVKGSYALLTLVDNKRWKQVDDSLTNEDPSANVILFETDGSLSEALGRATAHAYAKVLGAEEYGSFEPADHSRIQYDLFRGHAEIRDPEVTTVPITLEGSPFSTVLELARGTGKEGVEHLQLTVRESLPSQTQN